MQTRIFYVFEPSALLVELAKIAGQGYMAERSVWAVQESDRVGARYSKAEISNAHWVQFVANLVGENDESLQLTEFREKCLSLGFEGCWTVSQTKVGGDAQELMDEVQAAQSFLSQRGISLS